MANLTKDGFEMKQKFRKEKMRRLKNKAGMLSGGQAKIAAKAEPRDKIDAKDFAVLRAEKAKNRGKGLQDEKMKPGKIMKARRGKMLRPDPTKPISSVPPTVKKTRKKFKSLEEMRKAKGFKPGESVSSFNQRRMVLAGAKEAAKATRLGKIVLPIAAVGVGAVQFLKSKMKKNKEEPKKKMGGGMMMKRPMMARVGVMAGRDTAKKLKEARKKIKKSQRKKWVAE